MATRRPLHGEGISPAPGWDRDSAARAVCSLVPVLSGAPADVARLVPTTLSGHRGPVANVDGIVALVIAQQAVMIIRAFFKLGFWGAEVSAFRDLDEPRWCRRRTKKKEQRTQTPALAGDFGEPALDGTL